MVADTCSVRHVLYEIVNRMGSPQLVTFYLESAEILIGSLENGCSASTTREAPDGDDFVFESNFSGFVQCNHTIAKHYPSKM